METGLGGGPLGSDDGLDLMTVSCSAFCSFLLMGGAYRGVECTLDTLSTPAPDATSLAGGGLIVGRGGAGDEGLGDVGSEPDFALGGDDSESSADWSEIFKGLLSGRGGGGLETRTVVSDFFSADGRSDLSTGGDVLCRGTGGNVSCPSVFKTAPVALFALSSWVFCLCGNPMIVTGRFTETGGSDLNLSSVLSLDGSANDCSRGLTAGPVLHISTDPVSSSSLLSASSLSADLGLGRIIVGRLAAGVGLAASIASDLSESRGALEGVLDGSEGCFMGDDGCSIGDVGRCPGVVV